MKSSAATVKEYLAGLPADRRTAVAAVRKVILDNLDKDYEEGIRYGMIGYYVPHRVFPPGYHCDPKQPLPFAALGSQKNYMSLHLMGIYSGFGNSSNKHAEWFKKAWLATGKKLNMGKACVQFKKLDELPLEVIGELFRRMPAKVWIKQYSAALVGKARK